MLTLLAHATTILLYFFLSIILPVAGYLIPPYKVLKVNILDVKSRLIINGLVILILSMISVEILVIYLIFPMLTETLFILSNRGEFRIRIFDRAVVMSIISTAIIFLFFYMNRVQFEILLNQGIELENVNFGVDIYEIKQSINALRQNFLSSIFGYVFVGCLFLFYKLIGVFYENWKLSCIWLIPFVFLVIAEKGFNIHFNQFLTTNIIDIVKFIYIWYGIKTLFTIFSISNIIKSSTLKHILSILVGIFYPNVVFVLGAFASFDFIKIKIIRQVVKK